MASAITQRQTGRRFTIGLRSCVLAMTLLASSACGGGGGSASISPADADVVEAITEGIGEGLDVASLASVQPAASATTTARVDEINPSAVEAKTGQVGNVDLRSGRTIICW